MTRSLLAAAALAVLLGGGALVYLLAHPVATTAEAQVPPPAIPQPSPRTAAALPPSRPPQAAIPATPSVTSQSTPAADPAPPSFEVGGFDSWRPGARDLAEKAVRDLGDQVTRCRADWKRSSPYATSASADLLVTLETNGRDGLVSVVTFHDVTDNAIVPCFDGILEGAVIPVPPGPHETVRLHFSLTIVP